MSKKKEYKDVKEFTIIRDEWARGDRLDEDGCSIPNLLLDYDGQKCCLGFYCLAMGLRKQDIKDVESPGYLDDKNINSFLLLEEGDMNFSPADKEESVDCQKLMSINDGKILEKKRESKIKEIFKKNGVKVKFVNSREDLK